VTLLPRHAPSWWGQNVTHPLGIRCYLSLRKDRDARGSQLVVHGFEDGESWGFFLATSTSFSSPDVEIEMGGQAPEK
jgi:hypothetical protein